ncbi:MAG: hypothetical protein GXP53_03330 [Deltaproteobacteria bacterium]|nr:hypothetical protein [Deltaproteobacteria bacterium]
MANLQIKGIQDEFYAQIKALADSENRSISQQVLYLIRGYLAREKSIKKIKTPAQVLLDLTGSWADNRDAEKIINDIKKNRINSNKLSEGF